MVIILCSVSANWLETEERCVWLLQCFAPVTQSYRDAVGCIFMALALMRELTVVISLEWLRGLMSTLTASKTETHNFQQRPQCCWEIIQKAGLWSQPVLKSKSRFAVGETWCSSIFNGACLSTKNSLRLLPASVCL